MTIHHNPSTPPIPTTASSVARTSPQSDAPTQDHLHDVEPTDLGGVNAGWTDSPLPEVSLPSAGLSGNFAAVLSTLVDDQVLSGQLSPRGVEAFAQLDTLRDQGDIEGLHHGVRNLVSAGRLSEDEGRILEQFAIDQAHAAVMEFWATEDTAGSAYRDALDLMVREGVLSVDQAREFDRALAEITGAPGPRDAARSEALTDLSQPILDTLRDQVLSGDRTTGEALSLWRVFGTALEHTAG